MNQDKTFLGTEPIGKLLRQLAVPTVIAQLVNMLYNIVDRIYIGHIPGDGDLALTGVGVCLPLILIVSAFAALVASGGAPRASIYMGKQDHDTAEKILGGCFALQLAVSAVLTAVLLLWSRDLLLAFGASENTIGYAASYMQIYAVGTVFVQLTLGLNAFITAQGFAKIGMRTVLIGAVANIVLDPIFIYGLHMGVRGAALATILSQGLSCIWVLRFLTGPKTLLRLKKENVRFRPALILPCVALGTATFIMQASESVISVCFNSSLLKYGDDIAVGAMTILSSVMQFAMLPLQGIAQGAQPITSYNYGARNTQRVRKTFRLLLKVCLCYSVALWAVIQLCPGAFARIFTPNAALVAFTVPALRIYCGALFLFGIQIACQMTFVSIGAAGCSIIVAVLRKFVLLLPLIYLMPRLLADQTMAVYTAEPVADAIAVTCTAILFSVQFRKALRKLEEDKRALRNHAYDSTAQWGNTVSEETVTTRAMQRPEADVLLLRSRGMNGGQCLLADGSEVTFPARSPEWRERARIASRLMANIVRVPENWLENVHRPSADLLNRLSPYLYVAPKDGGRPSLYIAALRADGTLEDGFGNDFGGSYTPEWGYEQTTSC